MAEPVPDDTRGIVDPATMMRHVDFARYPAGDALEGVVEWFWSVAWDLPQGHHHDQQVLNHPAGNISIGTVDDSGVALDPAEGRVYGVTTSLSHRHLAGAGWTVAARSAVGGLGVLLDEPAKSATDAQLRLDAIPGLAGSLLTERVLSETENGERVEHLREALTRAVERRDPVLLREARDVATIAAVAEHDRNVRRVEQLAAVADTSVRSLQRLFDTHVGVSPSFVIRRWRTIEAADAALAAKADDGEWAGWAAVAADLGYADQAHLTRDFKRHLGVTPAAYVDRAAGRR